MSSRAWQRQRAQRQARYSFVVSAKTKPMPVRCSGMIRACRPLLDAAEPPRATTTWILLYLERIAGAARHEGTRRRGRRCAPQNPSCRLATRQRHLTRTQAQAQDQEGRPASGHARVRGAVTWPPRPSPSRPLHQPRRGRPRRPPPQPAWSPSVPRTARDAWVGTSVAVRTPAVRWAVAVLGTRAPRGPRTRNDGENDGTAPPPAPAQCCDGGAGPVRPAGVSSFP